MMRDYYKKMPGDRKDGWKLRNVPLFFTVVPFIMRTRLDSQDYYAETLDAEPMMDFMKAHKEDIPNLSMMTIFVAAMVRMISQRPALNRFVVHISCTPTIPSRSPSPSSAICPMTARKR